MARTLLLIGLHESDISSFRRRFIEENYLVDSAHSAARAMGMIAMRQYDAVIIFSRVLDDAHKLLKNSDTIIPLSPITILCVDTTSWDKEIEALTNGVTACRPFQITFEELLAYTRALLRRKRGYPRDYRIGTLGIDPVRRRVSLNGAPVPLRSIEFDILLRLAEDAGTPVHRRELFARVWPNKKVTENLLAAHIRNIRNAINSKRSDRILVTVRGVGYMLRMMN